MGKEVQSFNQEIEAMRERPPGEEPEDPYEDTNISELPDWWQRAIYEFKEHGLRPFRPTEFSDGALKPTVVEDLENEMDSEICFVKYPDDEYWTITIDKKPVKKVDHFRTADGFSVFDIGSDEFRHLIRRECPKQSQ